MALFAGHPDVHGEHGEPELDGIKWGIKRSARTLREPVTVELWRRHLSGDKPLGVVPIRPDNSCVWGSIDYDQYETDLTAIISAVEDAGLPLVPCRSKSGGLHLFLFLAEPQPAAAVQSTLRALAAQVGAAGSEIFPKQTQVLSERGDLGNWMVMPYFGDDYGGKLRAQVGLSSSGVEHTIGEFLERAEAARLTSEQFRSLTERRSPGRRRTRRRGTADGPAPETPFGDGPPCLEHMAESGVPQGHRNNTLFMMGLYYKKRSPGSWQRDVEQANHDLVRPPLTTDEVQQVVRQLERKDYEYTCKTEPMCSHCDSKLCRTRRHGVSGGDNWPDIESLSKMTSEPPIWFVTVDGTRIACSTEQLYNYNAFNVLCMESIDRCFLPMKPGTWFSRINVALETVTLIDPPEDYRPGRKLFNYLEDYLTARSRATRREDLIAGRPWEDEEEQRFYFRIINFERFLEREGVRMHNMKKSITELLESIGYGKKQFNFRGRNVHCVWIPSSAVAPSEKVGRVESKI